MTKSSIIQIIQNNPKNYTRHPDVSNIFDKFPTYSKPQAIWHFLNDVTEIPKCSCGTELKFTTVKEGYSKICPNTSCILRKEAIKLKKEATCIERYGVVNPMKSEEVVLSRGIKTIEEKIEISNKRKSTCIERYGVANPMLVLDVKETLKKTNLEKYGVEYVTQSKEVLEKRKQNSIEKYGVEHYTQTEESKTIRQNTCLKKYGETNPGKVKVFNEKARITLWKSYYSAHEDLLSFTPDNIEKPLEEGDWVTHKECGCKEQYYFINGPMSFYCRKCNPVNSGISKIEKELLAFVKNLYNGEVLENYRGLKNSKKEIDIYIPELNLGLEMNGLYWHSSKNEYEDLEFKNKHIEKTNICESNGINLFHLTDYDWVHKRSIIESMINQKLGLSNRLYARKCTIKEITYKEAKEFLDINHLQGTSVSSINLGLFYEEELVSLMTFGKPRFNKNYEWELIRFCNKLNHTVIGGASKLLRFFERKYNPKSIISYADRNHSNGELYHNLEFFFLKNTSPNYFWIYEGKILKRYNTQKHKLKEILGESFDENLSENSNLYTSGAMKYYDAGNRVYIKEYTR